MAERRNFLLGRGERLTEPVAVAPRPVERTLPYTFAQAVTRVSPMVTRTTLAMMDLPPQACPHDEGVAALTLNPEYIAKSYFPGELLRAVGMRLVGSRGRTVLPERRSRGREPVETLTTELFVAGGRSNFLQWGETLPAWKPHTRAAEQLGSIERLELPSPQDKLKSVDDPADELVFEVVLHAADSRRDAYILEGFEAFLESYDLRTDLDRRFYAGGLCFIALEVPTDRIAQVAQFSFLRVARPMPHLRLPQPVLRSAVPAAKITLPADRALSPSVRVGVFDGGLPATTPLNRWARARDGQNLGPAVADLLSHGHAVTSALLFGSLVPGAQPPRPHAEITHYRVLDAQSGTIDPYELYDILERIKAILASDTFDFINLSIGPEMPVDDNEVHAWTATLDEYLAHGTTLASLAVGNNGEGSAVLGYDRVQVPADCVNGLAVGATSTAGAKWARASYSAVGPGRSPGIVKPDVMGFGGCKTDPYLVLDANQPGQLLTTFGTSFAAPHVLRLAIGLRATFGNLLQPLALKALLVHSADPHTHTRHQVGWGRVPDSLEDLVTSPGQSIRVLYQGEINASKYLRARIPLPASGVSGNVRIRATFCFATEVDAAHPSNYTRSGLEIFFRPNGDNRAKGSMHAKTASFFRPADLYPAEDALRRDAHKWETCLHAAVTKQGHKLKNPVFDIHYNSRIAGRNNPSPRRMRYALVITVDAPQTRNLYDDVVRRYRTVLEPLTPVVQIPITPR